MPSNFTQAPAVRASVVLAVLLAVSLACVFLYAHEESDGALHGLQAAASGVFAPAKVASGAVSGAVDSAAEAASDAAAGEETLSALREQNAELREEVAQLEEYRQEAERLEGLVNLKSTYNAEGVGARVVARSTDSWNRTVTIDAGSDDGVRAGLPVLASSGLVGQVVSTTASTSVVRLLEDQNSAVAVIVQSSRVSGILRGSLDGLLYLDNVSDDAVVNVGDVVITSGEGGNFFAGIMVGTVVKVDGEQGSTSRSIVVEPNDSASAWEEVLVVTSMSADSSDASDDSGQSTQDAG